MAEYQMKSLDHASFEESSLCSMAISVDGLYTSIDVYITSFIIV